MKKKDEVKRVKERLYFHTSTFKFPISHFELHTSNFHYHDQSS